MAVPQDKKPQKADWEHTTAVYERHYTDQTIIVPQGNVPG